MNDRVEINHRTWQGRSAEQLGYEMTPAQMKRYTVPRKTLRGSREFNVAFADGRQKDTDPIIIMMPPYDQRVDELYASQIGITAAHRHALVATADPDVTIDLRNPWKTTGDHRPISEILQSFSGNYDSLARTIVGGIDAVLNLADGSEIEVQGPSHGTAPAVSLAGMILRKEYPYKVQYLDLIDPVNARSSNIIHNLKLLSDLLGTEAHLLKEVLDENTFIGHGNMVPYENVSPENAAIMRRLRRRQSLQTLLGGAGLRKGIDKPIIKLLTDPVTNRMARKMAITFFHGADSTVSLQSDINPTVDAINTLGGNAQSVVLFDPEGSKVGHHFRNSLGKTAELAIAMAEDRAEHY